MRLVGQAVKTLASHAENMGSIPVRVTKTKGHPLRVSFLFCRLVRSSNPAHIPATVPICTTYAFKLNFLIEPSVCALWVRISASPSRVETSWARLIPVLGISPGDEVAGFATLLRRFRAGSLARRSKFPYLTHPPNRVVFFSFW